MSLVQNILIFYQSIPGLDVSPSAWSYYEASKVSQIDDLKDEISPPYKNAMEAMRDGWEVIQISENKLYTEKNGYEIGPLPYQTVLSKYSELKNQK